MIKMTLLVWVNEKFTKNRKFGKESLRNKNECVFIHFIGNDSIKLNRNENIKKDGNGRQLYEMMLNITNH